MNKFKELIEGFVKEEDGIGVVEIILILVILVGLVVIFKDNISDIVEDAFEAITGDTDEILD
ncbi:putative flagellin with Flp1-like domain [Mobilisporobacter senegalensis]|uniref:Putative flagellin with Flp1-like domain n=1 Tax=Mobilisporobacter senegalensis TaxID=1329262 RepID=A0A3N1XF99_9FIRM|nr:Flp1 family type IVb pilin [Mobilisporobacter senegalensis]ROR23672.1 putative flagellin with Flp1-like domain [Mobilisporobacter senegalensis]